MKKMLTPMQNSMIGRSVFAVAILGALLSGCRVVRPEYNNRRFDDEAVITVKKYVDYLRKAATRKPTAEEMEVLAGVPELSSSMTTHFVQREFQVLYMDANYVSFRADMEDYHGGNGNHSRVFVGTISRKTGRILGVADFVPKSKWKALEKKLCEGAIQKIGGTENLQGEVKVIENFYYVEGKLHFVYNPYEIACGAAGAVEVVVNPTAL